MTNTLTEKRPRGTIRLAALMFFELLVFGSINPILSMYLQDTLRLTSGQTGFIMAMSVVSSIAAPLLSVYVVDRLVRAKRLFVLSQAALAASSLGLFAARGFGSFLAAYALNAMFSGPAMGMLNAITFQRLHDLEGSGRNYGAVRVWGTIGWMCAGYLVSGVWAWLPALFPAAPPGAFRAGAFLVAAAGSAVCIVLALGLPEGAPRAADREDRQLFPRAALGILKDGNIALLLFVYLLASVLDKMYSFGGAPYLASLGFGEALIPSILTLGQATEIVMLFALGALLSRLSYKPVLVIGALTQVARYALLCAGLPSLALAGVAMNGILFACLYSAILMYVDGRTDSGSRQAVHQLIQLFIGGASSLLGNLVAGALGQAARSGGGYVGFWLVPLGGAVASTLLIALGFGGKRGDRRRVRAA